MKTRRNALLCLGTFLLSLLLVVNPPSIGKFRGGEATAQSSLRPYVVFVNGYEDCCTWGRYTDDSPDPLMDRVVEALPSGSEIQYVPWDRFENGANQRSNVSNDAEFLTQAADFINNQLDPNRPLILIGHSFGGDSLLSLAPRINRRIQFLGVIDPVAAGGFREPITRRGVPSNVDYFFNRWQRNGLDNVDILNAREILRIGGGSARNVVPFDSRLIDGFISDCGAKTCDQQEQSSARREDNSEIRVSCEAHEVSCEGWRLPGCNFSGCWGGSNGTKAKGLFHNDMPPDEYLQRQMADRVSEVTASYTPPNSVDANAGVIYAVNDANQLLWYKHTGFQDGSRTWAVGGEAQKIGNGWGNFKHLFSGGNGVIYAVTSNNRLLWYKHTGWQDGSASWATREAQQIGNGWNFRQLFSGGDGVIYAVNSDNQLLWYKHTGWQDGSRSWAASGAAQQIGNGWNFRQLF